MANYIDAEGLTSTTYRVAYQAARALSVETVFVTAMLWLQIFLKSNHSDSAISTIEIPSIIANFLIDVLLIPYAIGVYRLTLGLPLGNYLSRFKELAHLRRLLLLVVGISIIDISMKVIVFDAIQNHLLIFVTALLAIFWLKLRLFVMQPALALKDFNVTARQAYRATAGRIWELIFIEICVIFPLLITIVLLSLLVFSVHFGLKILWPNLAVPQPSTFPKVIITACFSTFGLLIRSALEAEVFRRLFLHPKSESGR